LKTPHVVLSTIRGAGQQTGPTGVPHFDSKVAIERTARELELPVTFVRPSFFMENLLQASNLQSFRSGTVRVPVKPTTKIPMVSVRDIGEIAAKAFERPERRIGTGVELQGDSKTYPEIVDQVSSWIGIRARFEEMSDEVAAKTIGKNMLGMYRGFDRGAMEIDVAALEREWELRMTRFEDLLKSAKPPHLG
jgi:uncharacterized protein YbjT (DUF2867 family)